MITAASCLIAGIVIVGVLVLIPDSYLLVDAFRDMSRELGKIFHPLRTLARARHARCLRNIAVLELWHGMREATQAEAFSRALARIGDIQVFASPYSNLEPPVQGCPEPGGLPRARHWSEMESMKAAPCDNASCARPRNHKDRCSPVPLPTDAPVKQRHQPDCPNPYCDEITCSCAGNGHTTYTGYTAATVLPPRDASNRTTR